MSLLLKQKQKRDVLETFAAFDDGCKGYLDKDDLKVAATALLGRRPTKSEVGVWIRRAAAGQGGDPAAAGVGREAFLGLMLPLMDADELEEARCAFRAFDVSCRGFITMRDFKAGMREACPGITEARAEVIFREVDTNGSGRIDWGSFLKIMQKQPPQLIHFS